MVQKVVPGSILRFYQPVKSTIKNKPSPPSSSSSSISIPTTAQTFRTEDNFHITKGKISKQTDKTKSHVKSAVVTVVPPQQSPKQPTIIVPPNIYQQQIPRQKSQKGRQQQSAYEPEGTVHIPETSCLSWVQRHTTLLVTATTNPDYMFDFSQIPSRVAIAGFDLDSTIVRTKSRTPFPADGDDWQWLMPSVRDTLAMFTSLLSPKQQYQQLIADMSKNPLITPLVADFLKSLYYQQNEENLNNSTGSLQFVPYILVVFSNQGGVIIKDGTKRYCNYKERMNQIAEDARLPFLSYAATKASMKKPPKQAKKGAGAVAAGPPPPIDIFRKPEIGMWQELLKELNHYGCQVDLEKSFFVGDAAGRKNDFSNSDKMFAQGIGLKFFTPQQFFLPT